MEILIFVVVILSIWHYSYEYIILPAIHDHYRFILLEYRDKIRKMKIECRQSFDDQAFLYTQEAVNNWISYMTIADLSVLLKFNSIYRRNPRLRRQIEKRLSVINNIEIPEIKSIYHDMIKKISLLLILNNGGWFPYIGIFVLPILILIYIITKTRTIIKKFINEFIVIPEHEAICLITAK